MGFLAPKPPPPPKRTEYSPDETEEAEVAVPLGEDSGSKVRKRMTASRRRIGRSALQIPRSGSSNGLSIPKG